MRVAGLVLAAGAGARLGTPKALLRLGGETLVDRAVRVLRAAGCAPVYVVAGAVALDRSDAVVVDNPDWPSGMGSSLGAGLAAAAATPATSAVVVMVVDTPGIGADAVRRVVAAAVSEHSVVAATYAGRQRNPVLLGRAHWAEVARLATGDVGARAFLDAHPHLVTGVECGDVADPEDVDTEQDWARRTGPAG